MGAPLVEPWLRCCALGAGKRPSSMRAVGRGTSRWMPQDARERACWSSEPCRGDGRPRTPHAALACKVGRRPTRWGPPAFRKTIQPPRVARAAVQRCILVLPDRRISVNLSKECSR